MLGAARHVPQIHFLPGNLQPRDDPREVPVFAQIQHCLRHKLERSKQVALRAMEVVFQLIDATENMRVRGKVTLDLLPRLPYFRRVRIDAICCQSIQPAISLAGDRVQLWVLRQISIGETCVS